MEELESMTKNELIAFAKTENIYGFRKNDTKAHILQRIKTAIEAREVQRAENRVAIHLSNNIYSPLIGRLTVGIHIVPHNVAEELFRYLTPGVIKKLTPQEVAAYYGLSDGNPT